MTRRPRPAFTVLEILLALSIGVMLMSALYFAINLQMRTAQTGRQLTQQSTLVRSLFLRMESDVTATVNLTDPSRWRNQAIAASSSSSSSGSGSTSGTGTTGTGSTGMGTTGAGATSGASGSSTSSGSGGLFIGSTVVLPLGSYNYNGQICDNQHLAVHVCRFPREAYQPTSAGPDDDQTNNNNNGTNGAINQDSQGIGASDLRVVSYYFLPGRGLCRKEIGQGTFDPNQTQLYDEDDRYLIAPEVVDVTFTYFDGQNWQTQWDGTIVNTAGTGPPTSDGINPQGSPRAIKILLKIKLPRDEYADDPKAERKTKEYSHVILIPSANGPNPYNSVTGPDIDGGGDES